jgi:hypothetical protein
MIKKVVKKAKLSSKAAGNDLKYWLSRTPEERISAVEILRRQMHGDNQRLQRVARVTKRKKRSD